MADALNLGLDDFNLATRKKIHIRVQMVRGGRRARDAGPAAARQRRRVRPLHLTPLVLTSPPRSATAASASPVSRALMRTST
jgi:hypothetical protein